MKNYLIILIIFVNSASLYGQVMTTFAGKYSCMGFEGDGGPAGNACFGGINAICVDNKGNVYIADGFNERIRKVNNNGIISTVAGNGYKAGIYVGGFSGDGGPATAAKLDNPSGVAVDDSGDIYISDANNNRVRRVDTFGIINTIAGNGTYGYGGDGGPATDAAFYGGGLITVDKKGNLYFVDNGRVRKINTFGIISTVAGNGTTGWYTGDGGPAVNAELASIGGLVLDTIGNLYISDDAFCNIRVVDTFGIISLFAGPGLIWDPCGFSGDGGPAANAYMNGPHGLAIDKNGNIYIADVLNNRIRKISSGDTINTLAGSGPVGPGNGGYSGDGGSPTAARLDEPTSVAVDENGNVYIAVGNYMVRKIIASGAATVKNISGPFLALHIFPNPVQTPFSLHINGLQSSAYYSLLTTIGTEVQKGNLITGNNVISLATLPPSIYILEITGGDGQKTIIKTIVQ